MTAELDREKLVYHYKLALDRRKIVADLATLGLNSLIYLNGGAIIGLFSLFSHLERIDFIRLWIAFICFTIGLGFAIVAIVFGFFSSNDNWLVENSNAEKLYQRLKGASVEENKAEKISGNGTRQVAIYFTAFSFLSFIIGCVLALTSVNFNVKPPPVPVPVSIAPLNTTMPPRKSAPANHHLQHHKLRRALCSNFR